MKKTVFIRGNPFSNAKEDPKNVFHGGDLQSRIDEFEKTHNVIEILPVDHDCVLVRHEE